MIGGLPSDLFLAGFLVSEKMESTRPPDRASVPISLRTLPRLPQGVAKASRCQADRRFHRNDGLRPQRRSVLARRSASAADLDGSRQCQVRRAVREYSTIWRDSSRQILQRLNEALVLLCYVESSII